VLCCAIFAACEPETIDDTPTNGTQRPITFNGTPARAAIVPDNENNLVDNARIWAYYTANSSTNWVWGGMSGEKADLKITTDEDGNLTGEGALTINGNTKYWMDGTYYFFSLYSEKFIKGALEPYYALTDNNFAVNYDISDQKELRYACHLNTKGSTKRTDKVDFNYQHLLAKVKFQGYSKDDVNSITVTKVEISSVPREARVLFNIYGVDEDTKSITATYLPLQEISVACMNLKAPSHALSALHQRSA
jgi:hypothetical protein